MSRTPTGQGGGQGGGQPGGQGGLSSGQDMSRSPLRDRDLVHVHLSREAMSASGTSTWLMADPVAARLLAAGRDVDEAYGIVERLAIMAEAGGR